MGTSIMITARCDSQRFPNKMIAPIYGKPMIEWIIEKCKMLNNVEYIIVATTDRASDDKLMHIAVETGAVVYRGSSNNLFERHTEALAKYEVDVHMGLSGDVPFFDIGLAQALINASLSKRDCDTLAITPPHHRSVEVLPSGVLYKSRFQKYERMLEENPQFTNMEQYWLVVKERPEYEEEFIIEYIETSGFYVTEHTPVKCSIDYPIEMALAEKVAEFLGRFPLYYSEVIDAYKRMTTF